MAGHSERKKKKRLTEEELGRQCLGAKLGQLKTGPGRKRLSYSHRWCANDLVKLCDRLERTRDFIGMEKSIRLRIEKYKRNITKFSTIDARVCI